MSNLRHLIPFIAPYRIVLLGGLLCAAIGAGVSVLGPYVLRLAIDEIQIGGIVTETLLVYGGWLLLIAGIDGVFKFGQRMLVAGTSYRIEYDLRAALFERFMALDQGFYGQMHTGDLMARATNDLSAVRQFLGPGFNGTATALLTLMAAATFMFSINGIMALVVLLLLPLTTLVFVLLGTRMRRVFTTVQDQFGQISTRAQENFSGIRTIKAYAQEEAEVGVFAEENDHYRALNLRYVLLSGLLWPSMALILGGVAALVLLVGGQMVAQGILTLGELVQFNAYLGLLAFPMIIMGWMVTLYQQAAASMGRLIEVLHRKPEIATAPDACTAFPIQGAIKFRNVGICFHPTETEAREEHGDNDDKGTPVLHRSGWMLRHITFHVPVGKSLAIVGATGAGKTTLVNLLGRVRDPDEGQVLIDTVDVRQFPLTALRRAIGYVSQETFLFSVPLRENVTFGLGNSNDSVTAVSDERLDHAVTISRLSNDLAQFPGGLDTMVGERGVTLSGGQKQRVAVARAIMRDPAILILDDALSSVDTHTAAQILAGLRQIMQNRTSIIIAQRIATVKDADQIIVLHEGRIVEHGTHHELLRTGGRYAAMYRRELLEAEFEG
ncbi:MAG: ABC transporter ATP-binding protein/permease [Chloroflexales bacterium]|nr:ABC transporter ATP-binding protein/permease [Chloroflexales bacterium]